MTYELETGIPIPDIKREGKPSKHEFPFADMLVGQSFAVPYPADGNKKKFMARLNAAIIRYSKRMDGTVKFAARAIDAEQKARIWRIA